MPKMTSGVRRCQLSCSLRDIVEANDLIRRVSRGRNLYRMHLKRPEPVDLPLAQLTKFELTRFDSNVPAHAARLLSVLHLLRSGIWHTVWMPVRDDAAIECELRTRHAVANRGPKRSE